MCRHCVNHPLVDRGRFVSEVCVYLSNFKECKQCGKRENLKTDNRKREEIDEAGEDYEEIITFNHVCGGCGHVIGEHYYRFEVVQGMAGDDPLFSSPSSSSSSSSSSAELRNSHQDYTMECVLCGKGADSQPVIPLKAQRDPNSIDETYDYSKQTDKKYTDEKKCADDAEDENCEEKVDRSWEHQGAKENEAAHSLAQRILSMAIAARNDNSSSQSSKVISDDQLLEALSPDYPLNSSSSAASTSEPTSSVALTSLQAEGRVDTLLAPDSSKMASFFLGSAGIRARIQAAMTEQNKSSAAVKIVPQQEFWGDALEQEEEEEEALKMDESTEKSENEKNDSANGLSLSAARNGKHTGTKKEAEDDEWS